MDKIKLLIQVLILISVSPLVSGFIKKIKNIIRMRRGPGLFQPYYNMAKLLQKEEVISENTSWIFRSTPVIVACSSVCALFLVPVFNTSVAFTQMGDLIFLMFMLALGRFFLALAGLDAGSAFGGMGSSREMFISAFVEPAAVMAVFAVSLSAGSTSLSVISAAGGTRLSSLIASAALFIVTLAETSRIPVDNQETHLELTMVHEAMVLEYSGRSLALIEMAAHIKQIIFLSVISLLLPLSGVLFFIIKIAVLAAAVAVVEISMAKMRLFRVVDLLVFTFVLSMIAVIVSGMGV
ncbi:MAG: NADH-quinone oxidoreductase subunit H [Elusimicrobia bacterium]|nr:NADH-quinone oxidoreductase subunit H [Elusimicrobiota bacterium]